MKLPESLTTVTKFSKFIALVLFITLPFIGFFFGMEYQQKLDGVPTVSNPAQYSNPSPTPTPTPGENKFVNSKKTISFTYPVSWEITEISNGSVTISNSKTYLKIYSHLDSDSGTIDVPVERSETILVGADTVTLNYYTSIVTKQPSAYGEFKVGSDLEKNFSSFNFYLDKNNSLNDLQTIKAILASLSSNF